MPRPVTDWNLAFASFALGFSLASLFTTCNRPAWGADLKFQDPNPVGNVRSYQVLRNGLVVGPTWEPTALAVETPPADLTPCTTPGGRVYRIPVTPNANNDRWKIRVTSVDGLVTDSCNDKQLPTPTATPAPVLTATPTKIKPHPPQMLP